MIQYNIHIPISYISTPNPSTHTYPTTSRRALSTKGTIFLQVLLRRTASPLLIHNIRTRNHNLHRDSDKQKRRHTRSTATDNCIKTLALISMARNIQTGAQRKEERTHQHPSYPVTSSSTLPDYSPTRDESDSSYP